MHPWLFSDEYTVPWDKIYHTEKQYGANTVELEMENKTITHDTQKCKIIYMPPS